MAEFPALPFWTDAYISDTAHLTNEEHGVYLRLLMFAWRSPDCCLPDDDKRLAIMVGVTDKKWKSLRPVIASFWAVADGQWTQKRLTKERDFVRGKSQKNSAAAKARWEAKPLGNNNVNDANAMPSHMPEPCQTDAPTPTTIDKNRDTNVSLALFAPENDLPDRFDDFWQQYPHRNGAKKGKASAQKAWAKAIKARASPDQIIAGAMRYAGDRQVIQGYAKDPATWLNAKGWEDEVEQSHSNSGRGPSGTSGGMVAAFAAVAARRSAGPTRD
jgi:uncharacterized protein YdaU (DUF1376 family)